MKNKFFSYYNNEIFKVKSICTDGQKLYAFVEVEEGCQKIITLEEKDHKKKFDKFYERGFYDTAYEYAKSLNYSKFKISEISKHHGDSLYAKEDFAKSIEQYKLTITYLEPSYVIQKFLDGSKLEYLISYLEELHKNSKSVKRKVPARARFRNERLYRLAA